MADEYRKRLLGYSQGKPIYLDEQDEGKPQVRKRCARIVRKRMKRALRKELEEERTWIPVRAHRPYQPPPCAPDTVLCPKARNGG